MRLIYIIMSPKLMLSVISAYFIVLMAIAMLTSGNADNKTFFTANKQSPWYVVAFGMIGASLSGVTFISVPGWVASTQFSYMQMVLGYLVGYFVIGTVLLPLYYRLQLVSIYSYLEGRFGFWSYKTGAAFFLISRVAGASFRLYLVAITLQNVIFEAWQVPFWQTVVITIVLIWLYTFRGGIKTIVWTDTLQTLFMLLAVGFSIYLIKDELDMSWASLVDLADRHGYVQIFFWDLNIPHNFFKQFVSGAFIAIVMTGLDQDMMQKNLTCKNLKEAQKNMLWFSIVLVFVNLLFLSLGALLYLYASERGVAIPEKADYLFSELATKHFSPIAGITFILGLTAAAYSSADSALTSLTTSFCVDFLGQGRSGREENDKKNRSVRLWVHLGFSLLLFGVILCFKMINNDSVVSAVFTAAGFTYGPLLGLYGFALMTSRSPLDKYVPWVCIFAVQLSGILFVNSKSWFNGFDFGFFILIVNGALTFLGLFAVSKKNSIPEL